MREIHYDRIFKKPPTNELRTKTAAWLRENIVVESAMESISQLHSSQASGKMAGQDILSLAAIAMGTTNCLIEAMLRKQIDPTSFGELVRHKDLYPLLTITSLSKRSDIVTAAGHMHYHMALHRMCGQRVYQVQPNLAEKLLHTELRGLDTGALKLPHKSIYLDVPVDAGLVIGNKESGDHRVIGIYIVEDNHDGEENCWRFLVCGEPKPVEVMPGVIDDNDALIYFRVPLPHNVPLSEVYAVNDITAYENKKDPLSKYVDWKAIFSWAMNVVLYLSSEGAVTKNVTTNKDAKRLEDRLAKLGKSKKRTKLLEQLKFMSRRRRCVVGDNSPRQSWELSVRTLVSGHWRNQPYGPDRSLRRLQWIAPFWRGPENVEKSTTAATSAAQN